MANSWFKVPSVQIGTGPRYIDAIDDDGWSGNTIGNSNQWIVRVYADQAELNTLASRQQVVEMDSQAVENGFSNAANVTTSDPDGSFSVG